MNYRYLSQAEFNAVYERFVRNDPDRARLIELLFSLVTADVANRSEVRTIQLANMVHTVFGGATLSFEAQQRVKL